MHRTQPQTLDSGNISGSWNLVLQFRCWGSGVHTYAHTVTPVWTTLTHATGVCCIYRYLCMYSSRPSTVWGIKREKEHFLSTYYIPSNMTDIFKQTYCL